MRIVCTCCGSTVSIDEDPPAACPLCGRRAWRPVEAHSARCDVTAADEHYLKKIGIAWPSRNGG